MPTNVEVKAKIDNTFEYVRAASRLCAQLPEVILQEDHYVSCEEGRFKLRVLSESYAEAIRYLRPNALGTKVSHYEITPCHSPEDFLTAIKQAQALLGTVRKTRLVFHSGRTRIHLDDVDDLGRFLELEVVLNDGEDPEQGRKEASELLHYFGLSEDATIACSYFDLMQRMQAERQDGADQTRVRDRSSGTGWSGSVEKVEPPIGRPLSQNEAQLGSRPIWDKHLRRRHGPAHKQD
jgi:predicted adenylyl cyclase CyaB